MQMKQTVQFPDIHRAITAEFGSYSTAYIRKLHCCHIWPRRVKVAKLFWTCWPSSNRIAYLGHITCIHVNCLLNLRKSCCIWFSCNFQFYSSRQIRINRRYENETSLEWTLRDYSNELSYLTAIGIAENFFLTLIKLPAHQPSKLS